MTKRKMKKADLTATIQKIITNQPKESYTPKSISNTLQIKDKNLQKSILSILLELKKEGFLTEQERGVFQYTENQQATYNGIVDATSSGAAYIVVEELDNDIFIPRNAINHALHGDQVAVVITRKRKTKWEGRITQIIQRNKTQFIGRISCKKNYAFLTPENHLINTDLYIPLNKLKNAQDGDKVLAHLTSWPKGVKNPYGEIIKVIGKPGDNNAEMLSILLKNNFDDQFPQAVLKEAEKIGMELDPEEVKDRRDLRNKLTFTIDPIDAKDFDDALSFEKLPNGHFEVGIHIADVSHFVRPDTAMDKEAKERGNSVYLEDRVIPMLPENLSNMACSLRPNEDKFTFTALFEIDIQGEIYNKWYGKTVIHSDRRFTYEEAQEIIEGTKKELAPAITTLDIIAKSLRKKRLDKGALAIESEEIRFILADDGQPIGIKKKVQKDANKLIEEFMLLANKQVALFVGKLPDNKGANSQFIYRCHDEPDIEKLRTFSVFIDKFDYDLTFKDTKNVGKKINKFLEKIKNTPEYEVIQTMAIRTMSKADYRTANIGHYGLAFSYYTHFTSPIRRYADLIVHRILFDKLNSKSVNYGNALNEICKHISFQERKAIESERESNKFFQAKFLAQNIGAEFEGTVSGLADFGMFVRINENTCEGMIRLRNLPGDTFYFDADKFHIIGNNTRKVYNFGDSVRIRVSNVNVSRKEVDLELI